MRDPTQNHLWTKLKESIIMNGSKFRISSLVKTDDKVQLSCQAWHGQSIGNLRQEYYKIYVNSIKCGKSKPTQCCKPDATFKQELRDVDQEFGTRLCSIPSSTMRLSMHYEHAVVPLSGASLSYRSCRQPSKGICRVGSANNEI